MRLLYEKSNTGKEHLAKKMAIRTIRIAIFSTKKSITYSPNKNPIVKLASQSNTNCLHPVAAAIEL